MLASRPARRPTSRAILRLAAGAGLRVGEIVGLDMADVHLDDRRPWLRIRHGKGDKARDVPLWWDRGTFDDLRAYEAWRLSCGAAPNDPFVVGEHGGRLTTRAAAMRWKQMAAVLGARGEGTSPHWGRHTFGSYALASGRSLAEVRDAMGHSSIGTTSIYLHAVPDDGEFTSLYASPR